MSNFQDHKWVTVKEFKGLQTKFDPTKIEDGANANGQNTSVNNGDRITLRNLGYEIFPSTASLSLNNIPVNSLWTFRKRDGTNILLRARDTFVEWFEPLNNTWEKLVTGLTAGKKFGYAHYNINTDQLSYNWFCNGVDNMKRWDGSHTTLTSNLNLTDVVINVTDTSSFGASGTVIVNGATIAYASKTPTTFVVAASGITATAGQGIATIPADFAGHPKGNIMASYDNRLWISGISTTPQSVYFSKYGDSTDFSILTTVTASTAQSSGAFNLIEGGGAVTNITFDEQSIYLHKDSMIYKATLTDSLYTLQPFKPFDGKALNMGSIRGAFTGSNATFFVTPDNQIMSMERVTNIDYPQAEAISDIIKTISDQSDFSIMAGIAFKDKAYFACKSATTAVMNDTILVWNHVIKEWDSPITGLQVSDWAIYNNGTTKDLYFASALDSDVYKINTTPTDRVNPDPTATLDITGSWKSKQFDFGDPTVQKEMSDVFIEGYITPQTKLNVMLYIDDNGFSQKLQTVIDGSVQKYLYSTNVTNTFGLTPFGTQRFGSNDDSSGKVKFRVYLGKDFRVPPFYNAQIEFISTGQNQQWEIEQFAFKVGPSSNEKKYELIKAFK